MLLRKHSGLLEAAARNGAATQALMMSSLAMILLAQIFIPGTPVHEWLCIFCASLWIVVLTNLDERLNRTMPHAH